MSYIYFLIFNKRSRCRLHAASTDTRVQFRRENCRFGANYGDHARGQKTLKLALGGS